MIPRALRGLRGRLLLALVFTSAVTLIVAAAVTLSPLRERLREQSITALRTALADSAPGLDGAIAGTTIPPDEAFKQCDAFKKGSAAAISCTRAAYDKRYLDQMWHRSQAFIDSGGDLRSRTDARIMILDASLAGPPASPAGPPGPIPGFLYDSYSYSNFLRTPTGGPPSAPFSIGLQALQQDREIVSLDGDQLTIALPLHDDAGGVTATLIAQRRLTDVVAAVALVRNALLTAAAIGLAVAIGLGIALSNTLTRRLDRLRRTALRITAEGPEAPAPRDVARDEVGDLGRALARMQEEMRRQEAARRSFVATASHELRTPLTILQGTMELLDEDLSSGLDLDDAKEQVTSARRELRRLAALATELLDLSRLDADVQLRSEPVELGEIARAVAAEFALPAAERSIQLDVVPPSGPCWARADPDACARVVRILLDNALRYAPAGEPIAIRAQRIGPRATVEVADRGPGVPEDERERVFERFHRGRASAFTSGFGLGLAIGRELAERMGGTLDLEDAEIGARFRLALPATAGSSPSRAPAPDSGAAARS